MRSTIVVGIDIGTHTTRVVVCEVGEGFKVPRIVSVGESPSYGVKHGYVINRVDAVRSVRSAVRSAEQEAGLRIKEAVVSLGGVGLSSYTLTTKVSIKSANGEVLESDVDRAVIAAEKELYRRVRNVRIVDQFPLKYYLDGKHVLGKPLGMKGAKLSVSTMFVTFMEHHLDDLVSVITDAGVNVSDVVPSPLASSLVLVSPKQKMTGVAFLDVGAETTTLAVFDNGAPISIRVFPVGSNDITNDIALAFKVSLDEAELAKLGNNFDGRKIPQTILNNVIEARADDIYELVDEHLKVIKKSQMLPAGIVIAGGGSSLEGFSERAKKLLKLPVKVVGLDSTKATQRKLRSVSWYTAYGLCMYQHEMELITKSRFKLFSLRRIKRFLAGLLGRIMP